MPSLHDLEPAFQEQPRALAVRRARRALAAACAACAAGAALDGGAPG